MSRRLTARDAFEYLLSVLGSQGDAGQFRTPRHIINFIVEVLDPKKNEKILDPACGTAGFLISAYKHILKNAKKGTLTPDEKNKLVKNIAGYELDPTMKRFSLVNMYLHGFTSPNISEFDTLTSEDKWNDSFDIILANPPFMTPKGGIRPHKKFSIQANRSEVLFVDYIAEHIHPVKGRAGIIVPEGIIFQSATAYKALRKMLVDQNYLYAVVSLPAGIFQPYSGVKTSILLFDKTLAKKTNNILFIKIENDGFDLGSQRRAIDKNDLTASLPLLNKVKELITEGINNYEEELTSWIKNHNDTAIRQVLIQAVAKEKIAAKDYNLSFDRFTVNENVKQSNFEMLRLESVCSILSGYPFNSNSFNSDNGFPLIRIRDIKTNSTKTRYDGKVLEDYIIQNGDLIIGMDGEFNRTLWNGGNALLNQRVCKLQHFKNAIKEYVYRLIEEPLKNIEKQTQAVTVKHISGKQILNIEIPLPPLAIQQQIVAKIESYQKIIDGAKQVTENYKPQIDIDEKWEMVKLGDVCEINPETIATNEIFKNSEFIYLDISSVENGSGIYSFNNANALRFGLTVESNMSLSFTFLLALLGESFPLIKLLRE